MNKISLSDKGRYCVVFVAILDRFVEKRAKLGRFSPGSCLPFEKLGRFKVAIGRDFVDYDIIGAYFSTRNLHEKLT